MTRRLPAAAGALAAALPVCALPAPAEAATGTVTVNGRVHRDPGGDPAPRAGPGPRAH